jgi:hypothetical protein
MHNVVVVSVAWVFGVLRNIGPGVVEVVVCG